MKRMNWDIKAKSEVKVLAKTSTRSVVWTVASVIIKLSTILYAVTVHSYREENDGKSTCGGTGFEFKIERDKKFLI